MFEAIEAAPRDPILGLTEAFREDPNPKKINLSVGVYQDATGKTPILESVRQGRASSCSSGRSRCRTCRFPARRPTRRPCSS